jgi:cyclin-dependent kinase regulatory subunit CKS1
MKYCSSFYSPEPHILLFRRPLGTDPQSGRVDPELERKAREEYRGQFGIVRK